MILVDKIRQQIYREMLMAELVHAAEIKQTLIGFLSGLNFAIRTTHSGHAGRFVKNCFVLSGKLCSDVQFGWLVLESEGH